MVVIDRKISMKRDIIIPNVNKGESFEVPERKPKHRIAFYKKMIEIKKETPELYADQQYNSTMSNAYLALYIIQDKYPDTKIDDILDMPDTLEENSLFHLGCIVNNTDYKKLKKQLESDDTDFRQNEKNPTT